MLPCHVTRLIMRLGRASQRAYRGVESQTLREMAPSGEEDAAATPVVCHIRFVMPIDFRFQRAAHAGLPACLLLSSLTALMVAAPESPSFSAASLDPWWSTWWLALTAASLTLGCVFAHRSLLVGGIIGGGVPLAQSLLYGNGSLTAQTVTLIASVLCASLGSILGRTLRRIVQARAIPVRA